MGLAMTGWLQEDYINAYRFAAEAHNGQLVPGTGLPYVVHISLVSMEVIVCLGMEEGPHNGNLTVQCALLHDVIEDTDITFQELEINFGKETAAGVQALTKDKTLAKELRIQDSLQRIRQQPVDIWMVKLADRITNLSPPPSYWDKEKIRQYRNESVDIYNALNKASDCLGKRLEMKIEACKDYL